jgi:lipopolysaccharide transport system ATP-binding protein
VEPDILVVDEALSVGDEAFQRKCFARIRAIQERGGTILFVSHSATSIIELCNSAILMDRGELLLFGSPKLVVSSYHKLIYAPADRVESLRQEVRSLNHQSTVNRVDQSNSVGAKPADSIHRLSAFYDPNLKPKSTISYESCGAVIEQPHITTLEGEMVNILVRRTEYIYTYRVKFNETVRKVRFGMLIKTVSGLELAGGLSHTPGNGLNCVAKNQVIQVEFRFCCLLQPGMYFLNAGVVGTTDATEFFLDRKIDVAVFRVQPDEDTGNLGYGWLDLFVAPKLSLCNSVASENRLLTKSLD